MDFGFPGNSIGLASEADQLGYYRYWLGEHHSPYQCSNPLLVGAVLALNTQGLRLGSGGVCLRYHSPYKIAEDARLIEALLPKSFDLGVTNGLALDKDIMYALLDGNAESSTTSFYEKLRDLHGLLTGRLPSNHPMQRHLMYFNSPPPMWLLGTGPESARWAAHYGIGFCFSLHHAPSETDAWLAIETYRTNFKLSPEFPEPAIIVVVSGICAATEIEAQELEQKFTDTREQKSERHAYRPTFSGSPEQCTDKLSKLWKNMNLDEIMILDLLHGNTDARIEMYRLLADSLGIPPRPMKQG